MPRKNRDVVDLRKAELAARLLRQHATGTTPLSGDEQSFAVGMLTAAIQRYQRRLRGRP